MTIAGRAIGFCLGALTRNPLMIAIGLGVGYVVDLYLDRRPERDAEKPDDPYETLGIPRDASDDDVDRAYRRLMGQYHPDKVAGAADEIRRLAEQRATAINLAYESIQKRRRRR